MILWTTQMFMSIGGPPIMWSSCSTDTLRGGLLRCFHARNIGSVGQRAAKSVHHTMRMIQTQLESNLGWMV